MNVLNLIAGGAIVFTSIPSVLGHGYITDPAATWKDGYAVNGWGSSIDSNMWGAIDNSVYGYGTSATVAFFEAEFNASGYNSLGQFIETNQVLYGDEIDEQCGYTCGATSDEIDEQCGYTVYDSSARQTMPSTNLSYTGFTHPGPCEVWCDDTKVLFDYNCQATYPDIPAGIPYDESLCADANRFTIYWLAVHGAPWQVYTDCVWLDTGSGSGSAPSPVTETVSSSVATAPPTTSSGSTATATTAYPDTSSSSTGTTSTTTTSSATTAVSTSSSSSSASTAETSPIDASTAAEADTGSETIATTSSTSTATTDASSETSATTATAPATSTSSEISIMTKCSRRMRRN
ncbi:hypothetical protein PHMEG_0007869 [Phytophthora megakarya]|uniref:Carbohydrate-binding protein n=1 Tax=Phytophthora megakarya TaxID=4795 RepID=A0A225WLG3_9STRA|nr:hypothetical protein PHMEG_0007869 [Phytophthora megakarya]